MIARIYGLPRAERSARIRARLRAQRRWWRARWRDSARGEVLFPPVGHGIVKLLEHKAERRQVLFLDCAVIDGLHQFRAEEKLDSYDSVRAAFSPFHPPRSRRRYRCDALKWRRSGGGWSFWDGIRLPSPLKK